MASPRTRGCLAPLRIDLELGAPIVVSGPVHFDALLAWAKVLVSTTRRKPLGETVGWEPESTVSLPLARMQHEAWSWWRASAVEPVGPRSRAFWTSKWEHAHEDRLDLGKASQVPLGMSALKDYKVPLEIVHMPRMTFWAVGDRPRVKDLLRRLPGVGKKVAQGYGVIRTYQVTRLEEDLESFDRDWRLGDSPARNLPVEFCRVHKLQWSHTEQRPLLPPYWRMGSRHQAEVACL